MSIKLPDGRLALRTVLVDRASGQERVLFERAGRACHFDGEIRHGGHIILLRLDWRDLIDGDPKLDADVYRIERGLRGKKRSNGPWHHTPLTDLGIEDVRGYRFAFDGLVLDLIARKTMAVSTGLGAYIVDPDGEQMR